jgi:hypothetical protein
VPVTRVNKDVTIDITELDDIKPKRIDQVENPASGIPVLVMKSIAQKDVNPQGGITETPDIDGAEHILQLLAKLIESEAREMAVGSWDESCDIQLLSEIASLVKCFRDREMWNDDDDGDIQKALESDFAKEVEEVFVKAHRKFSAESRRSLASEGNALPDGSYPIPDADALRRAAILARSGHGNVAAAKRLIAKRAKELGVSNPLAEKKGDAAKSVPTQPDGYGPGADYEEDKDPKDPEEDTEPTVTAGDPNGETQTNDNGEDITKAAITEAIGPLKDELNAIKDQLAKVLSMPVPGGPAISAPPAARAARAREELLTKAARMDRLAETMTEPDLVNYYRAEARQARADAAA